MAAISSCVAIQRTLVSYGKLHLAKYVLKFFSYYQEAILLLSEDTTTLKKKERKALKNSQLWQEVSCQKNCATEMALLRTFYGYLELISYHMDTLSLCMSDKSG